MLSREPFFWTTYPPVGFASKNKWPPFILAPPKRFWEFEETQVGTLRRSAGGIVPLLGAKLLNNVHPGLINPWLINRGCPL